MSSTLDDDHPLQLINGQIEDLLEGLGAPEDHQDVIKFLRATGLPERTVERMHRAIVCAESEFEIRGDGKRVRKDRWQVTVRRIVALIHGNRHEFECDDVVEDVRRLVPKPFNDGDDEGLVNAVLGERNE